MKKIISLLLLTLTTTLINAQSSWKKIDSKNQKNKSELIQRKNFPKKYTLYNLSITNFKNELASKNTNSSSNIISLPSFNGDIQKFSIKETSYFEKGLAEKFPNIKSYTAIGIDDKTATAKISTGTDGVHIIISSKNHSTLYIDPYNKKRSSYISYQRNEIEKHHDFECLSKEGKSSIKVSEKKITEAKRNANDETLRTYRIAIACTGEYSKFHLNNQGISETATDIVKKEAVLSAMNTTITRVNSIYERELSVRMIIVNDNDKIIFLDPDTDNMSNTDAGNLIDESQELCDKEIGNENYDIGHTFSTGGGGLAGVGVVCIDGEKARGITGSYRPINDPFDIDYVAHEIGHQFGAPHTFNGTGENCTTQTRVDESAVEPGSGSTIMAYAGICSPQNIQKNSDDYFHAKSIESIWATIINRPTCAKETNTNNPPPTADAGSDVFVPKSTPLVLRGVGTDPNNPNDLTHNWDQMDNEIATMPPLSTSTAGPVFRSLPPTTSPNRYLPALPTVIAGSTSSTWEVIPSVAREMNFRYTVRDNFVGGGANASDDIKITVTNAAPFEVTSQNSNETWNVGVTQVITWNKSTTDEAPINCKNVRIKLSTDGGSTFPITLVESTPNDGYHSITVPNHPTSTARIMIEAVDNIFYNVNTTNFSISADNSSTFFLTSTTKNQTTCKENSSVEYILALDYVNGFNEEVTFSASQLPNGTTATFTPTSLSTSGKVTMKLSKFTQANAQDYTVVVTAKATSIEQTTDVFLNVFSNTFSNINLTTPRTGEKNAPIKPTLEWEEDENATSYDIRIATDDTFENIIETSTTSINSYDISSSLISNTTYYWTVKPINKCAEGNISSIGSFTTESCKNCPSKGSNEFKTSITQVTFNTINNTSTKTSGYTDYSSDISTNVTKEESYELTVNINTDGDYTILTKAWIDWDQNCLFDSDEEYDLGSVINQSNGATSNSPISIVVPADAKLGNTTMRLSTKYTDPDATTYATACENNFDGEVEDYNIFVEERYANNGNLFSDLSIYPNPTDKNITLNFRVKDKNSIIVRLFDLRGRLIIEKKFSIASSIFLKEISLDNINPELYILQIENDGKLASRKVIIK